MKLISKEMFLFVIKYLFVLFLSFNLQGQVDCTLKRYIDDIFDVHVTQEPAIYATAPDIPSVYLGEGTTFPQDLSFDFYEPVQDTVSKRPLIVMAFGGAFLGGDKRQPELVAYCEALTRKGYCVVSIDYRIHFNILSTSSSVRAVYRGLQDFRAAVRFFRHHATTYKIDPEHIYGGGNSAGAINALHAAFVDDSDRTVSSIFGATFGSSNAPDLGCIDCSGNLLSESGIPNAVVNLWGGIGETFWIEKEEAPIISFHGLDDTTVSPNTASPFGFPIFPVLNGSIPIHTQANFVDIINELHVYPGEGHELWNDQDLASQIYEESADFILQLFKPSLPIIEGHNLVCSDSTYTYSILNAEASSQFCWNVQNGIIISSDHASITIQWNEGTEGSIEVIELNEMNAQSEVVGIEVNINPSLSANYSFDYSEASILFTNNSSGGVEFFWNFGDGGTSTLSDPTHTYNENGIYEVELTITGPCGLSDSYTETVVQNCQPDLVIVEDPTPSGDYQAFNTVSSSNSLEVGSMVFFKAGHQVNLHVGFEANKGDLFEVNMVICSNE